MDTERVPEDDMIQACMELRYFVGCSHRFLINFWFWFSVMEFVRLSSEVFSDWWFPAHFFDLLVRLDFDFGHVTFQGRSADEFREVLHFAPCRL